MKPLDIMIGGSGGGKSGGSGGGLSEQSDSLKSTSYAQVLDLISEGEIGGLVDGAKSIYLDGVPVQNADLSYNFTGISYIATNGTQTQAAISGYDETSNEFAVGVEVKISSGPISRTISNSNVTTVIVTVQIPALTNLDSKGNLGGASVNFAIDTQLNAGGWVEKINDTITGKSSGAYQRQYRIQLPAGTTRNVRVRRITADSTSSSLNDKTFFQSYTEVIDGQLRYPNSALVAVKVDAAQFRSIPTRGYDVKLLLIKFPTNATVRADGSLAYSGTWDGTFQVGWCACPAWAYYDLVTTGRYGLGDYITTAQLSKWDLYTISQYCNELIANGFGGTEPRFTCNVWINSRQEAFKVLADLTSCFRGMAYWGSNAIAVVQDSPKDPSYLFTNANVIDGAFRYEGSSAKARHTVALVTWNDPADLYRQKVEYVEDTAGIARYGVIETEIVAFGCTSRGQAHRAGRWVLYSERNETEVCTFRTGSEGANCRPGDVIKVADQDRAGVRQGGRIVSATTTSITVDSIAAAPAVGSTLYVLGSDGVAQTRTTTTSSGSTINVTVAFSPVPAAGSVWVLSTSTVNAQTFRVLSVAETAEGEHEIVCLDHDPTKFAAIETGITLQNRQITSLNPVPGTPSGLTVTQSLATVESQPQIRVTAKWTAGASAVGYKVEWRAAKGNWQQAETTATEYDVEAATPDLYEFRVCSLNAAGTASPNATASLAVSSTDLVLALASTRGKVWTKSTQPTIAESNIGDTWLAPDGTLYDRVNSGGILLGGFAVTLGGFRPQLVWTQSAVQPVTAAALTANWDGITGTGKPEDSADVTSAIAGMAEQVIQADYAGAVTSPLPKTSNYSLVRNGLDITTAATWSVDVTSGTMTATMSAGGALSITTSGGTLSSGALEITAIYGATTRKFAVKVTVQNAAPPAGTSAVSGEFLTSITLTGTTWTPVTDEINVTSGSTGKVDLVTSYEFYTGGTGNLCAAQWYHWNGSAYVAIGTEADAYQPVDYYFGFPGVGSLSFSHTGLGVGTAKKYKLYMRAQDSATSGYPYYGNYTLTPG